MQLKKIAAVLLGSFAIAGSASAVTFESASGAANVTNYSSAGLLSFDLDFATLGQSVLNFSVEAADVGSSLSFNALARMLNGISTLGAQVSISGATFSSVGSFGTDGFQSVTGSGGHSTLGWASFSPALTTEFYVGAPLGNGTDWSVNLAGLNAGDTFSITVAVPEPEQYAMFLAGLGLVGAIARRRKSH